MYLIGFRTISYESKLNCYRTNNVCSKLQFSKDTFNFFFQKIKECFLHFFNILAELKYFFLKKNKSFVETTMSIKFSIE